MGNEEDNDKKSCKPRELQKKCLDKICFLFFSVKEECRWLNCYTDPERSGDCAQRLQGQQQVGCGEELALSGRRDCREPEGRDAGNQAVEG